MENKEIRFDSDYIFPDSDFWSGVASVMGVSGNFYRFRHSNTPDQDAIKSDWEKVAKDLLAADAKLISKKR